MGMAKSYLRQVSPGAVIQGKDVVVTSAQVLALFTTPIAIVPAPKAGFMNILDSVVITKPAGTAYTIGTGGTITVKYTNAAGLAVAGFTPTGFADQATSQTREVLAYNAATGDSGITPVAAAALVLSQATANMTGGTSAFRVRPFFRQVPATI